MKNKELKFTKVNVRGVVFKLMTYTRSLELCARMNYETENLDFIDKIKSNEVMYDLGACEGRFSIYAAKKGIRVISFEPEAKNYHVFSENLKINEIGSGTIKAIHAGVGEKTGQAIMKIGQPWEGGHQKVVEHGEIRNDLGFNFVEDQKIDLIALDSFIETNKYPLPDYLKVDIDGSEMPFLKGASNTLKSSKLKGIIFELNEKDSNYEAIITILKGYGFIEKEKYQVPNEPFLFNFIFEKIVS